MNKRQTLIVFVLVLLPLTVGRALSNELHDNIKSYQEALIRSGVTGSSIAGVFRGAETLAVSAVSSNLKGDKAVTEDTIFPIWSMSKVFVSTIKCPVITNSDTMFERYSEAAPLAVFFCIII